MQDKSGNWQNLVHRQDSFDIDTVFQGRLLNIVSVKKNMHETRYRCEAENSQSGGNPLVHDIQLDVEGKWPRAVSISCTDSFNNQIKVAEHSFKGGQR